MKISMIIKQPSEYSSAALSLPVNKQRTVYYNAEVVILINFAATVFKFDIIPEDGVLTTFEKETEII
jgi:hypothetical protein